MQKNLTNVNNQKHKVPLILDGEEYIIEGIVNSKTVDLVNMSTAEFFEIENIYFVILGHNNKKLNIKVPGWIYDRIMSDLRYVAMLEKQCMQQIERGKAK